MPIRSLKETHREGAGAVGQFPDFRGRRLLNREVIGADFGDALEPDVGSSGGSDAGGERGRPGDGTVGVESGFDDFARVLVGECKFAAAQRGYSLEVEGEGGDVPLLYECVGGLDLSLRVRSEPASAHKSTQL